MSSGNKKTRAKATRPDPMRDLVANAVDFLTLATEEFKERPKHSIIAFHSAVELFLKARLMEEHWSLAVSKAPDLASFENGDFVSVSFEEACQRLAKIVGSPIPERARLTLDVIRKHSNKMVHFFQDIDDPAVREQIAMEQLNAWHALVGLIGNQWRDVFDRFQLDIGALDGRFPAATDIAFALGVITLLGKRVPASLRIFLAALAIIDDLGAVLIIALFYTADLSLPDLAGAVALMAILYGLNCFGVRHLLPYLLVGGVLWFFVYRSGIHATLAGVVLALSIPLDCTPARPDNDARSPLHRLEQALHLPVGFLVVPIFGLANAGVPVLMLPASAFAAPVTLGAALGLLLGKVAGVLGLSMLAIRLGIAHMPAHATWLHMLGVALLCGIGFTMSIFITLLAFPGASLLQAEAKLAVLMGSLLSGLLGYGVLSIAIRRQKADQPAF